MKKREPLYCGKMACQMQVLKCFLDVLTVWLNCRVAMVLVTHCGTYILYMIDMQLCGILGTKKPRLSQIWGMKNTKACCVWIQLLLKPQLSWNLLRSGRATRNSLPCHQVIAVVNWILERFYTAFTDLIHRLSEGFLLAMLTVLFMYNMNALAFLYIASCF